MLTLTTPITIPNIQKMHVAAVQLDGDNAVATVTVVVQGTGNVIYNTYQLTIRDAANGSSQGIQATVSPLGYADRCQVFSISVATAFSDLVTAYTGVINARNKAAETVLQAAGLLPAGSIA